MDTETQELFQTICRSLDKQMEEKQEFIFKRIIDLVGRGYTDLQLSIQIDPVEY